MKRTFTSSAGLLTLSLALVGCTHWDTTRTESTLGPRQEVGRRLVGSPMIEESTESALVAGAGGVHRGGFAMGGVSAGHSSVKRTHCVQQAEIDYSQRIDLVATRRGRGVDLGISIPMLAIGTLAVLQANQSYQNGLNDYRSGWSTSGREPESPTAAFAVGGALAAAGAAWLIYSVGFLPKDPPPEIPSRNKTWTEKVYVEADGCGLPGDRASVETPAVRASL